MRFNGLFIPRSNSLVIRNLRFSFRRQFRSGGHGHGIKSKGTKGMPQERRRRCGLFHEGLLSAREKADRDASEKDKKRE